MYESNVRTPHQFFAPAYLSKKETNLEETSALVFRH